MRPTRASRFSTTEMVTVKGQSTFGYWNMPTLLSKPLDPSDTVSILITSDLAGRPDLIAQQYYNMSELDWLIIAFNHALDVFNWPKVGTVITIPSSFMVATQLR